MNYLRVYKQLVSQAVKRKIGGYVEKHHIVPKCLGGGNEPSNIVLLTAKEHFVAHKLLVRIYPDEKGVWYALIAMGRIPEFKSRIFASERLQAANARRGSTYSAESRKKMSLAKKGLPSNSPKTTFQPGSIPWNAGRVGKEHHMYGTKRTEGQRARMSEAQRLCGNIPPSRRGVVMTEAQKAKARAVRALNKQRKLSGELQ